MNREKQFTEKLQTSLNILYQMANSSKYSLDELLKYRSETHEAKFLFDADVTRNLEEVFRMGLQLDAYNCEYEAYRRKEEGAKNPVEVRMGLKKRIHERTEKILSSFDAYLDLKTR